MAERGAVSVAVITGSRPAPLTGARARPVALRAMQAEALNSEVQKRLAAARKAGEITYQDGFAPKPAATGAGKGAATGAATGAPAKTAAN